MNYETNISALNRSVRLIIGGIAVAAAFLLFTQLNIWVRGLGLILIVTGLIGFCPLDHYFHMKQQD